MMKMEKTDKSSLGPNEFSFYLDAWVHCWKNSLDITSIKRKSWDVWFVDL